MSDNTLCSVEECSSPSRARGLCNAHYLRWYRGTPAAERTPVRKTAEERFWSYVDTSAGAGGCWPWTGAASNGYGVLGVDGTSTKAHRVSLLLHGKTPRAGDDACHKCDNPICVNPAHLYFGTRQQNVDDAIERGRVPRGEQKHGVRLTTDDVVRIREDYAGGAPLSSLVNKHGVHKSTVLHIVYGNKWKHVGGPITKNRRMTNVR